MELENVFLHRGIDGGLCCGKVKIKKHFLDKPILRYLFWFIVLPHRLKCWTEEQKRLSPEMAKVRRVIPGETTKKRG